MNPPPGDDEVTYIGNVGLTGRAHSALIWAACHTGDHTIDVINRALIAYAHMVELGQGEMVNLDLAGPAEGGGAGRRLVIWRRRNRRGK